MIFKVDEILKLIMFEIKKLNLASNQQNITDILRE